MLLLFFLQPYAKINLEFAARVIHGLFLPEAVMKTRIRRLYDIANILSSLRLIEKTHLLDSRKPAFRWLGVEKELAEAVAQEAQQRAAAEAYGARGRGAMPAPPAFNPH